MPEVEHLYQPLVAVNVIVNDNRTMYEFADRRATLDGYTHARKATEHLHVIE
jgi:hypothetical protein